MARPRGGRVGSPVGSVDDRACAAVPDNIADLRRLSPTVVLVGRTMWPAENEPEERDSSLRSVILLRRGTAGVEEGRAVEGMYEVEPDWVPV